MECTSQSNSPIKAKKRSQSAETWRRLRKNRLAVVSMIIIILFVLMAILADVLYDYDEIVIKPNVALRLQGPSSVHPLGTDEIGRDVLARIVHGSRVSLMVGFVSVTFALLIGGTLGAVAGYYDGPVGGLIMRATDIFNSIPAILLSITIVTAFGNSMSVLIVAVGISSIPAYVRIVRASVMTLRDQEFVEASLAIGARNYQVIVSHIIPNCLAPIIVQATLRVASGILNIAGLSFIGSGVKAPIPEWGSMLAGARPYLRDAWHLAFFPGLAIIIVVLALNLVGDGLRDALDPKLRN